MSDIIKCPACETKVVLVSGKICPACKVDVTNEKALADIKTRDVIWDKLREGYLAGKSYNQIEESLFQDGFDKEIVSSVAGEMRNDQSRRLFESAFKPGLIGVALLVIGLSVSIGSIVMSQSGGTVIIVAYGAVIVGLANIILGLSRYFKARKVLRGG